MLRLLCLVLGYGFGLLQTGYIYGKLHNIDIRNYGSGNSGTTNALRVLGKKAGAIVFFGDFLKAIAACLLIRILLKDSPSRDLYELYAGFGVVLGHNFPFYLKFKGGKGIASMAGILAFLDIRIGVVCLVVFLLTVILTRYVSLGSIFVVIIFFVMSVFFGINGDYVLEASHLYEYFTVTGFLMVMAIWRHRANIRRLLSGTENKLWGNKK